MAQIVVFVFSVTLILTFDLCSIFVSHALRMMYWNIHAKFHKNPSNINVVEAAVKVLKNALCFIMGYLFAMEIRVHVIFFGAILYRSNKCVYRF